jgi:hypothetical protein
LLTHEFFGFEGQQKIKMAISSTDPVVGLGDLVQLTATSGTGGFEGNVTFTVRF